MLYKDCVKTNDYVKAIVPSGYSNYTVMTNFGEYGFKAIVPKPHRPNELSNAIR